MGYRIRRVVASLLEFDVRLVELDFHPELTANEKKRRKESRKKVTKSMADRLGMFLGMNRNISQNQREASNVSATGATIERPPYPDTICDPDTASICSSLMEDKI